MISHIKSKKSYEMSMKKRKTKNNRTFNEKIYEFLSNIDTKKFVFVLIIYNIIGICTNYIEPFPLYGYFAALFSFIAIISVLAIRFFLKQMNSILIEISGEPKFRVAKYEYEKIQNRKIIFIIPIFIILLYAGTGIPMIESFSLNCSMLFALVAFAPTVYFSILVYIEYIILAVFIYNTNTCDGKYLSYIKQCPANSKILYLISELVNLYRNSFFTIGTAYIIAFGLFTLSNAFGVNISTNNICFMVGWGIIAIAIVIMFPIISILEKRWISSIIRNLKIVSTQKIQKDYKENNSDKLQASTLIISIWQTPDYPIRESISWGYGVITIMVNLVTMLYYAKELFIT